MAAVGHFRSQYLSATIILEPGSPRSEPATDEVGVPYDVIEGLTRIQQEHSARLLSPEYQNELAELDRQRRELLVEIPAERVLPGTEHELQRLLAETGLSDSSIDKMVGLGEPAALLEIRNANDEDFAGGHSQIGGYPMLPTSYPWPESPDGEQLSLVAQIDLDALPDTATKLPNDGLLQFYLPLEEDHYLGEPFEGGAHVLWFEETAGFVHRSDGRAAWGESAMEVDFRPYLSLPSIYSSVPAQALSEDELEKYQRIGIDEACDTLGGWSMDLQNDARAGAALDEAGVTGAELAERAENEGSSYVELLNEQTQIDQWKNLLELCLTPGGTYDGMWGDAGTTTWTIRNDDLSETNFGDTWWHFSSN